MRGLQARSAKHNMARKERFESAGPSPQSAKKRPLHILLLEDDDVDAKLFRLQAGSIRSFTLIVDRVATCAEADERLRSLDYDLCIFDFWLAGESTLPLIEKLGGRAGKMPIIILTGLTIPSIREMGFIAGAASFLGKDHLAAATLEDAIATALEAGAVEKTLRQDAATAKRLSEDERAKLEAQKQHLLVELNAIYACATMVRASLCSIPAGETAIHLSALKDKVEGIRAQLADRLFEPDDPDSTQILQ